MTGYNYPSSVYVEDIPSSKRSDLLFRPVVSNTFSSKS